jgi:hypothetical protein
MHKLHFSVSVSCLESVFMHYVTKCYDKIMISEHAPSVVAIDRLHRNRNRAEGVIKTTESDDTFNVLFFQQDARRLQYTHPTAENKI